LFVGKLVEYLCGLEKGFLSKAVFLRRMIRTSLCSALRRGTEKIPPNVVGWLTGKEFFWETAAFVEGN